MFRSHRTNGLSVLLITTALFLVSLAFLLTGPSPDSAYLPALYTINADGSNEAVLFKDATRGYWGPAWSPDGRLAFTSYIVDGYARDLFLADANGKNPKPLTGGQNYNYYPAWSPDGKSISYMTFSLLGQSTAKIHIINIDTKVEKSLAAKGDGDQGYSSWSPDGKQLTYDVRNGSYYQIFIAEADGTNAHAVADGRYPSWSPDGRSISFASNRTGTYDIFVMEIDGSDQHKITDNGNLNINPVWSPDGQRIAFISGLSQGPWHIYVMNSQGGAVKDLTPNSEIQASILSWSPDGQRIIFSAIQYDTARQKYENLVAGLRLRVLVTFFSFMLWLFAVDRFLRLQSPPPQKLGSVTDALKHLEVVRNPLLKWVFRIMPLLLILAALIGVTPALDFYPPVLRYFLHEDLLYYSGVATAGVSLLIFQILLRRIPEAFQTIWQRNVVAARVAPRRGNPSARLEEQYRDYIDHLNRLLDHPRQIIAGVICGLLGASWVFYHVNPADLSVATARFTSPFFLVQLLIGFGIGYVVGLQAWRMIVIGYQVRQLGKRFDLTLQLGHPDECEGLSPLGNLCLWNALIASPAGIDLGGWLVFGNTSFQGLFYFLLLVVIIIASLSFFAPLWNVHEIMAAKRDAVRQQLDQLGENMNRLARELLEHANELDAAESEKLAKKLDRMKQTYLDNQRMATWPFNTRTLGKFITSQIVPLLGLTGLGQPIRDIIFRLVDFFK